MYLFNFLESGGPLILFSKLPGILFIPQNEIKVNIAYFDYKLFCNIQSRKLICLQYTCLVRLKCMYLEMYTYSLLKFRLISHLTNTKINEF